MRPAPATPADAHAALRPLAQALAVLAHAHLPGHLHALLLALLASLLARPHILTGRLACAPWHPSAGSVPAPDSAYDTGNPRVDRYWRAFVDWLLNGRRNYGMAPHGAASAPPCPARTARAPPRPDSVSPFPH